MAFLGLVLQGFVKLFGGDVPLVDERLADLKPWTDVKS